MAAKTTWDDIIPALKRNPELQKDLGQFVDNWPMINCYTPPENVTESIRQIVILALNEAAK
jgi:hypothetical protein